MAVYRKGIPTVLVAHDRFESAAKAQAKALGVPDLPMLIIPQPMPYGTKAEEERKADNSIEPIIRMTTKPVPRPAR
ncbi:MAG: hypothetical protein Q7T26_11575 [Dehalococcoidia bacterium]|nr:hypothetical protein [Dehalococcoidia bacterium]